MPNMIHTRTINSPVGPLAVTVQDSAVIRIQFRQMDDTCSHHPLILQCEQQLQAYFQDPDFIFTLPVELNGTPLQQKIWHSLQLIPRGKTLTYGDLAHKMGTHPRIIGNACRANPLPIIFPCHRIVARTGLGGFAGHTDGDLLQIKMRLLDHERILE